MFALIKMNEIRKDRLIFNLNADGHYKEIIITILIILTNCNVRL